MTRVINPRKIARMKLKYLETHELEARTDLRLGWHGNQTIKDKLNELRLILNDKSCVVRLDKTYHDNFKQLEYLIKEFCKVL